MFSHGCNYSKLKANLQLSIQRLKLLEKKKTEMAIKSRREIADYLAANKPDRARIRVETIIREENTVEAMELLEMFCDLLVARSGLMKAQANLDPGLEEAVVSLIWASPRMEAEVQELKVIADQLRYKYGREFFEAAVSNSIQKVNDKLLKKMSVQPPEKRIVELYLVEIARSFNVPFTPDPSAFPVPSAPSAIDDFVVPTTSHAEPQPQPAHPGPMYPIGGQQQPMQPLQPTSPTGGSTVCGGPQEPPPSSQPSQSSSSANYMQPGAYPGAASAPVYTTLPPPYQPSDAKGYPPGWYSAADSGTKEPLPNDPVNQTPNVYPQDSTVPQGFAGMPTVPGERSSGELPSGPGEAPPASFSGAAASQQPSVEDASLDDLEKRFEELRRKK